MVPVTDDDDGTGSHHRREGPGRPHDGVAAGPLPHALLRRQLGAAVHADRCGRIVLRIRRVAASIEHEVRADVDQSRSAATPDHVPRALDVDPVGSIGIGLTPIHIGHRRAVDHGFGGEAGEAPSHIREGGHVHLFHVHRQHLVLARALLPEGPPKHPLRAGDENPFHRHHQ